MEFRILGPLEVVAGGEQLVLGGARQRAVLAVLIVRSPSPVSVDLLVDELWSGRPPATAVHAVQVYVSRIRKILRAGGTEVGVRGSPSGYVLEADPDRIDARRFERLVEEAQRALAEDRSDAWRLFSAALGMWRGAPLPEFSDFEFARHEADRLEELHTVSIEHLMEGRLAYGEHAKVIGELTSLVAANPLRERPRRLLMLALYRGGRHAEALATYRDACEALDEIGLQPGPELRQLQHAILRHDKSLGGADAVPDPHRDDAGVQSGDPDRLSLDRGSVPAPAHPLVGRTAEMSNVLALLSRGEARLVTLLGPGGSGKTRLALEVARELAGRYRDGAWFVSIAPLSDPALVASEIARALGLKEIEDESLPVTLANALAPCEGLLVLDNFEQVIGAAGLVSRLLAAAPRLQVLVTSREALRVGGEHRVDVPPLPLADAAELFLQRAQAIRADIADHSQEQDAVERICLRLDRLPLALELAAARVAVFSVSALEARLAQRLDLPEGARDLPDRQRTLTAAIGWSYLLLSPSEQALVRGLAPFAGGARLDAIETVFTGRDGEPIDTVAALVDKSLLRRREDPDGSPRFWMLETIRAYAGERAVSDGESEKINARHAAYFRELAEEAARHLLTAAQSEWLDRLQAEHDNLRAAFEYLINRDPSSGLRLAAALGRFWEIHGYISEGRERLRRALDAAPASGGAAAKASEHAGWLAFLQGDVTAAERLLLESTRLAREADDTKVEVYALSHLGLVAESRGDVAGAIELHERALVVANSADDNWALMIASNNLGATLSENGQTDRGRILWHEALALSRRVGDLATTAIIAGNLGELALIDQDLDAAASVIPEAVQSARAVAFGSVAGWALSLDALLALQRGELDFAEARLHEAVTSLRATYDVQSGRTALAIAAAISASRGKPLLAARLWAALEHETNTQRLTDTRLITQLREQWLPTARDTVNPTDWEAAWTAGIRVQPKQALEFLASQMGDCAGATDDACDT